MALREKSGDGGSYLTRHHEPAPVKSWFIALAILGAASAPVLLYYIIY